MSERCGCLVQEFPITYSFEPHLQCLLPDGHEGEHLVQDERGRFWIWGRDWDCDCPEGGCDCIVYGEVDEPAARALLTPLKFAGPASTPQDAT